MFSWYRCAALRCQGPGPSMQSVPCEYLELYFPLVIEKYELVEDSGGPGYYRGGNGIRMHYRFLAHGEIALHDDRWLTKPWGVNGGEPGKRSRRVLMKASGEHVVCGAKAQGVVVEPGDVLSWETWGGGGKGDPLERDATLVALEVDRRLVTVEGARQSYGVVLNVGNGPSVVDTVETVALRKELGIARDRRNAGILTREPDHERSVFNRGGTIQELMEACEAETGLPPPVLPSLRTLRTIKK